MFNITDVVTTRRLVKKKKRVLPGKTTRKKELTAILFLLLYVYALWKTWICAEHRLVEKLKYNTIVVISTRLKIVLLFIFIFIKRLCVYLSAVKNIMQYHNYNIM